MHLKFKQNSAFALVTVLGLLSFVFLLIFTTQSLLHTKSQTHLSLAHLELSKQNARLALQVAIGELQDALQSPTRAVVFSGPSQTLTIYDTSTRSPIKTFTPNNPLGYQVSPASNPNNLLLDTSLGSPKENLLDFLNTTDLSQPIFTHKNAPASELPTWQLLKNIIDSHSSKTLTPKSVDISLFDRSQFKTTYPTDLPIGPIIQSSKISLNSTYAPKTKITTVHYTLNLTLYNPYSQPLPDTPYEFNLLFLPKAHIKEFPLEKITLNSTPHGTYKSILKTKFNSSFKPHESKTFSLLAQPLDLQNGNLLAHNPNSETLLHDYPKQPQPQKTKPSLFLRLAPQNQHTHAYQQVNFLPIHGDTIYYESVSNEIINPLAPIVLYNKGQSHLVRKDDYNPLKSLHDLNNFNLTPYAHHPDKPISSSNKPHYLMSDQTYAPDSKLNEKYPLKYDYAYLFNEALYNHFYLQTTSPFNINTTSLDAWKSILPDDLALKMTDYIESYGPFMSVSDFINRSLNAAKPAPDPKVLESLGDAICVHTDTFVITASGHHKNAKSTCQATLQRHIDTNNNCHFTIESFTWGGH